MDKKSEDKRAETAYDKTRLSQSYNDVTEKEYGSTKTMDDTIDEKSDDSLNLGQIIKETGDFGRFQVLAFIYTCVVLVTLGWSMLTMVFTATIPDWSCVINDHFGRNVSESKVCAINGTKCDHIVFDKAMSTAVSQVR